MTATDSPVTPRDATGRCRSCKRRAAGDHGPSCFYGRRERGETGPPRLWRRRQVRLPEPSAAERKVAADLALMARVSRTCMTKTLNGTCDICATCYGCLTHWDCFRFLICRCSWHPQRPAASPRVMRTLEQRPNDALPRRPWDRRGWMRG